MMRARQLIRDCNLVDEHGHPWTATRLGAEFIIAASLVGLPWLIWTICS